ncbi:MDIS1-interacting receptor like kinase 2-like [Capsicum annuum]
MSFKSLLTDPSNRLSSWKGDNCCNWKGIKCSSSGHVVVVNLQNPHPDEVIINANKEVVNLSPLLFTIDHIQYLDLSFNNFVFSKLPAEISNLTNLAYLNLSNSMFQDSITTQFSNLTSLRSLDVSCANLLPDLSSITVSLTLTPKLDSSSLLSFINYGYLSSQNLRWLEGLQCLRYLVLTGVDISKSSESFHWEKPISSLSNLMSLQLSNCNISGRIPTVQLLNLTIPWSKLTSLDISFTREGGTVPPSLSNSTSITVFLDDGCSIEGSIPPSITKLKKLRLLMLNDNDITGQHPVSMSSLTSLQYFKNNLNVDTPLSLFRKSRLDQISFGMLEFTSCNMRGEIPKFFSNLTGLIILILANNSLSGAIPYWLFNLPSLSVLDLLMNNFKGVIPPTIQLKSSPYPTIISLAGNNLQGPIPSKLENVNVIDLSLNNLVVSHLLNLGQNKQTGTVQKELERVTSLRYLDLNGNEFEGSFPTAIEKFQDLEMLNLAGNIFEGRIPKFIVYSYNTRFDVSPSALTGKIPEKIGLLNGIPFLNLSHNNLFGLIPKSIGNMISLESLDLSCNNFTGEIPVTLTQLDFLAYLNLSYNNLSGRIPTNPHFDTLYQDGTAYIGNKYLCGAPDGMNRSDNNRPSTNETTENRYDQENILFVLVILSGFVTGISSVFLLLYLIADNWRNRYWRSVDKILLKIVN